MKMVATKSQMLTLGTQAPEFILDNTIDNSTIKFGDYTGKNGTLVFFICNHCPYVIHVRENFKRIYEEYNPRGITFIAINSNSIVTHPKDGPEHMKKLAQEMGWKFPFLFDKTQEVAKAYNAACTPDFFLFDKEKRLYYRGQFDDSRPGSTIPVTGDDLIKAMDMLLEDHPPPKNQKPSMGCNIKWAPGNEPHYFGD